MGGEHDEPVRKTAGLLTDASALFIGAGAGMGVDSGLPDFRGTEGFWRAYPAIRKLGHRFEEMANPDWFERDPRLAWGFYGHRLNLYRRTRPHAGFDILLRWLRRKPGGGCVFTSNVDGQFQTAGFTAERVVECHGSIHRLQCAAPCSEETWTAPDLSLDVDGETLRAEGGLLWCSQCGGMARPNILMFGDWHWVEGPTVAQQSRMARWLQSARDRRAVVLEFGAGMAVPTVRHRCEQVATTLGVTLIRVNPRDAGGPRGTISIELGAKDALTRIEDLL